MSIEKAFAINAPPEAIFAALTDELARRYHCLPVAVVLNLPLRVVPEFIVQLGRPFAMPRVSPSPVSRAALDGIVYWENYPG